MPLWTYISKVKTDVAMLSYINNFIRLVTNKDKTCFALLYIKVKT